MPHSKTPGGQAASDKFQKQDAAAKGLGADNAPGHTDAKKPGEAPVASDSGAVNTGIEAGTNQPGEKGIGGKVVDTQPTSGNANMK